MDYVFSLDEEGRAAFFHLFGNSLGCAYICLWSFFPSQPSNLLVCKDGWWNESYNTADQPSSSYTSSSSSTIARNLFYVYRASLFDIDSGGVPGLVSKEGFPYLELKEAQLLSLALKSEQQQFYLEAGIKTVCFLGSKEGEIEFGTCVSKNASWHMEIMELCAELLQQTQASQIGQELSIHSSSSSSFISLSMGSPECSSLFFNKPTTGSYTATPDPYTQLYSHGQLVGPPPAPITSLQTRPPSSSSSPTQMIQQSHQMPTRLHGVIAPSDIDEAMTRAMLAVISSPPNIKVTAPFYQSYAQQQAEVFRQRTRAFKRYMAVASMGVAKGGPIRRGPSLTKRAFAFLKRIPREPQEGRPPQHEVRPTATQLHHMISERKRREKLNEHFQALRKLLPVGTKKHKASILSSTIETMEALRNEVTELNKKIKDLSLQLITKQSESSSQVLLPFDSNEERVHVQISEGSGASSSSEREVELQVAIEENACNITDLVTRLLECLKQMNNVTSVRSIEARTQLINTQSFSVAIIRLVIKTNDWNENSFKEKVTKAVDDKPS